MNTALQFEHCIVVPGIKAVSVGVANIPLRAGTSTPSTSDQTYFPQSEQYHTNGRPIGRTGLDSSSLIVRPPNVLRLSCRGVRRSRAIRAANNTPRGCDALPPRSAPSAG